MNCPIRQTETSDHSYGFQLFISHSCSLLQCWSDLLAYCWRWKNLHILRKSLSEGMIETIKKKYFLVTVVVFPQTRIQLMISIFCRCQKCHAFFEWQDIDSFWPVRYKLQNAVPTNPNMTSRKLWPSYETYLRSVFLLTGRCESFRFIIWNRGLLTLQEILDAGHIIDLDSQNLLSKASGKMGNFH